MRADHLLVAFLVACGSSHAPPPTNQAKPPPPPPVGPADPQVYCDLALEMLRELAACTKMDVGMLALNVNTDRSLGPVISRKSGAQCALFMEQMLIDPEGPKCTFVIAPRRAELTAFVDGYYAERTKVTPTGDERRDRALQALAKHRDEVCACDNPVCTLKLEQAFLDGHIEPVGGGAPKHVLELADRLLDEVARCASDLRFNRKRPR